MARSLIYTMSYFFRRTENPTLLSNDEQLSYGTTGITAAAGNAADIEAERNGIGETVHIIKDEPSSTDTESEQNSFWQRFKSIYDLVGYTSFWTTFQWQYQNSGNNIGNPETVKNAGYFFLQAASIGSWSIALPIILIPFVDYILSERIKAQQEKSAMQWFTVLLAAAQLSIKFYAGALGWTAGLLASYGRTNISIEMLTSSIGNSLLIGYIGIALDRLFKKNSTFTTVKYDSDGSSTIKIDTKEEKRVIETRDLEAQQTNLEVQRKYSATYQAPNRFCRPNPTNIGNYRLMIGGLLEGVTFTGLAFLCVELNPVLGSLIVALGCSVAFSMGYSLLPKTQFEKSDAEWRRISMQKKNS